MDVVLSRKQRLRTLENKIRDAAGSILNNGLSIGAWLCEIRDDELWADEHESWNKYLKESATDLIGKSFAQATSLMRAAEVHKRLPGNLVDKIGPTHLTEIARLAPCDPNSPSGTAKDYSGLRTQDVARVLKKAVELAASESPSVQDVRKAVDEDLGVKRGKPKPEPEPIPDPDDEGNLKDFISQYTGEIEGMHAALSKNINDDAWKLFNRKRPSMVKRLIAACERLTEFLRTVEA